MPTAEERRVLRERDGYHCRFCGIPVIRKEIREKVKRLYPAAVTWGRANLSQHAAFQALWLQYDHVLPHSRGGDNSLDNLVITCAPCNYAKWSYHVSEIGLLDPRGRPPRHSWWDGLERFK
ncbi:HNH endonuclease [Salinisphaera sp. C84B14]|uniref:HNH endonuclease n=1 Tax=Salinisphaera sp. C84B14 TaxID=1304155 RepID=UPI003340F30C